MFRKSTGPTMIGPEMDSQQNVFNVHHLGRSPFLSCSTGDGILQSFLFDAYTKYKTKKGTKRLNAAKVVLSNRGLSLINCSNDEEFYSLSSIVMCRAVVFTGSKTKISGKKYYKFAFENLAEVGRGLTVTSTMPKAFKYLLKAKHQSLVVCILRRELGTRVLEGHAFVCGNNDQALSLSYSIEMARSVQQNEEKKTSSLTNHDQFPRNPRAAGGRANSIEPDFPQVMDILKHLGCGRGSVVNPVIKTSNVNLINDDLFVAPSKLAADKSQRMKPAPAQKSVRATEHQNRVYHLNQEDFVKPTQASNSTERGHCRSSSFDHLSHAMIFREDMNLQSPPQQQSKAPDKVKPSVQRSKSLKGGSPDDYQAEFPQHLISNNPSGGFFPDGGKPSKPVAMVQPRKIGGIKVFPQGNDRTGLIPDRDKLRRRKNSEESKPTTPTNTPDRLSFFSPLNRPGYKSQRNQFVIKSSSEDQLKKMEQEVSLERGRGSR